MTAIIIISLVALVVVLLLVGRYLLNDLSRLWWKRTRVVFIGHDAAHYCEMWVVLLVALFVAVGAAALKGAAVTLLALLTTGNLVEFTTALRGTFSFNNELQLPRNNMVMLLANPLLKLLATWTLMQAMQTFFRHYNKRMGCDYFMESDGFYFSSIAVICLVFIDLFWHTQNVKALNATTNTAYLLLDKLFYFIAFLSLYWIQTTKRNPQRLQSSLNQYLVMGNAENKIVQSPALMLLVGYIVGLLMSLPNYLGLQWERNNLTLITVFVAVLGVAYLVLVKVFSKSWNYLGTIMFDASMGHAPFGARVVTKNSRSRKVIIVLMALVGIAALVFTMLHPEMMVMFVIVALALLVGMLLTMMVMGSVAFLVGLIVDAVKKQGPESLSMRNLGQYFGNATLSFLDAMKGFVVAAWLAFALVVVLPKGLDFKDVYANGSIVDTNGDVLLIDEQNANHYYVPVTYDEIPDFFKKALMAQEDRCFQDQHGLWPNKSNWHGLSFAFLKNRGGSNLNAQLVKNLTFMNAEGFPRDVSRKGVDMVGGIMLSEVMDTDEIMERYVNVACFHGARGFRGANAASLYAFGRPLYQLNKLEQLYLVNTLPRTVYLKEGKQKIAYTMVQHDSTNMVKEMLLDKAERWKNARLISKKEFNELKRCSLGFSNRPYRSGIPVPTRLRLESETDSAVGRQLSYVTLENEQALQRAFEKLQSHETYRKNGAEMYVATLVVDVATGHVIGHYSSGIVDFTDYRRGFPIGSLGKPAIITQMLSTGASPNMTLFDGRIGKRKTSRNANHGWTNRYVGITEMLSKSLNAPFNNICDVMNPRDVFTNLEATYQRMGIVSDQSLCEDTYNYPLGNRQMTVEEVANLYQTLFNDGVHVPLTFVEQGKAPQSERIFEANDVAVVKNALEQTVVSGTMKAYRKKLPEGVTFYSKTGTSSGLNDGWNVLCDGHILIVTWSSYATLRDGHVTFGTAPLYGASSAGLFNVLVYNEIQH